VRATTGVPAAVANTLSGITVLGPWVAGAFALWIRLVLYRSGVWLPGVGTAS